MTRWILGIPGSLLICLLLATSGAHAQRSAANEAKLHELNEQAADSEFQFAQRMIEEHDWDRAEYELRVSLGRSERVSTALSLILVCEKLNQPLQVEQLVQRLLKMDPGPDAAERKLVLEYDQRARALLGQLTVEHVPGDAEADFRKNASVQTGPTTFLLTPGEQQLTIRHHDGRVDEYRVTSRAGMVETFVLQPLPSASADASTEQAVASEHAPVFNPQLEEARAQIESQRRTALGLELVGALLWLVAALQTAALFLRARAELSADLAGSADRGARKTPHFIGLLSSIGAMLYGLGMFWSFFVMNRVMSVRWVAVTAVAGVLLLSVGLVLRFRRRSERADVALQPARRAAGALLMATSIAVLAWAARDGMMWLLAQNMH